MARNNGQKKSSFSLFSFFKGGKSSRTSRREYYDEHVKAYKVYPSDEDRVGWIAEPRIDEKASMYISSRTDKWKLVGASY